MEATLYIPADIRNQDRVKELLKPAGKAMLSTVITIGLQPSTDALSAIPALFPVTLRWTRDKKDQKAFMGLEIRLAGKEHHSYPHAPVLVNMGEVKKSLMQAINGSQLRQLLPFIDVKLALEFNASGKIAV